MPNAHAPAPAGRFTLALDGFACGFVRSATGGGVSADVVAQQGPEYFDRKRLGALHYEDLLLEVDLSLHRSVYTWVADTLTGGFPRHSGSVAGVPRRGAAATRLDFTHALLTGVTFPALDGNSKEPGYLTLRLTPELTRTSSGPAAEPGRAEPAHGHPWRIANFRLEIDGLDCSRVSRIEALRITQVLPAEVGEVRDPATTPSRLRFPDVVVTLAESSAQTWLDWRDGFLVGGGGNAGAGERQGKLSLLGDDHRVLAELRLVDLGMFRWQPATSGADRPATVTAGLYCERMEFSLSG